MNGGNCQEEEMKEQDFFFECYTEEYAKDAYIFMDIPWPETCMA